MEIQQRLVGWNDPQYLRQGQTFPALSPPPCRCIIRRAEREQSRNRGEGASRGRRAPRGAGEGAPRPVPMRNARAEQVLGQTCAGTLLLRTRQLEVVPFGPSYDAGTDGLASRLINVIESELGLDLQSQDSLDALRFAYL